MEVGVAGLGLWMPGFAGVASWLAGVPDAEVDVPSGVSLGRVNRRRAGVLGRALADAIAESFDDSGVDPSVVPTLVGSSIGEAKTMVGILDQMWRSGEPVSPAAFTVSVHNAASGLISIAHRNRGYASSMAADAATPAASLYEAMGLVATTGSAVAIVCGDEPVPFDLVSEEMSWPLLAAAVVLVPLDGQHRVRARMRLTREAPVTIEPPEVSDDVARHPQTGLLDLVDAVARGASGCVALDRRGGVDRALITNEVST